MYSLADVYGPMDVVFLFIVQPTFVLFMVQATFFLFMVQATFVYSPGDDFVVLKLESVTKTHI